MCRKKQQCLHSNCFKRSNTETLEGMEIYFNASYTSFRPIYPNLNSLLLKFDVDDSLGNATDGHSSEIRSYKILNGHSSAVQCVSVGPLNDKVCVHSALSLLIGKF